MGERLEVSGVPLGSGQAPSSSFWTFSSACPILGPVLVLALMRTPACFSCRSCPAARLGTERWGGSTRVPVHPGGPAQLYRGRKA